MTNPVPSPAPVHARQNLTKDLISVGVFAAVYLVVYLAFNMLGVLSPVFQPPALLVAIVFNGITVAAFVARTRRRGMLALMGLLLGLVLMVLGHHPMCVPVALLTGWLADVLLAGEGPRSPRFLLSYTTFSLWNVGAILPWFLMRDGVVASVAQQMGEDYARRFNELLSTPLMVGCLVGFVVSGLIGAVLGRRVVAGHLSRAGLV